MAEAHFAPAASALAEAAGRLILAPKMLYSFLSADKRKTYCLYEADGPEAIREAAERAGLPADVVIELAGELRPEELVNQ